MLPFRFGDPRPVLLVIGAILVSISACDDSATGPQARPPLVDRLTIDGPVEIRAMAELEYTIHALDAEGSPVAGADSLIDVRTSDGLLAQVIEVRDVDPADGRVVATVATRQSGQVDLEAVYRRPFQVSSFPLEIFSPAPSVNRIVGTYQMSAILISSRTTCIGLPPSRLGLTATVERSGTSESPVLVLQTEFGEISGAYEGALLRWSGTGQRVENDTTVELTMSGTWSDANVQTGFADDLRLVFRSDDETCEAVYMLRMSRVR